MKTIEELRKLAIKKLREEAVEVEKKLFHIKFEVQNEQSKNHHKIKDYRKLLAQIKTLIREKQVRSDSEAPQ